MVPCVSETVCPAIVNVAVRGVCAGFAAIVSATLAVPGPLPLAVTQAGSPDTVQVHQFSVVTLTVLEPPAGLAVIGLGVTV